MALRDHEPIVLELFNGLWQKGEDKDVPQDHFADCENIQFTSVGSISTRDGVGIHQDVAVPLTNILRLYNYITQDANTLIVLVGNGADGEIYHVVDSDTVYGPVLTITGMTDFAFQPYAGRAYISPFNSTIVGNISIEKGLENEFLYVYEGDGTPARKAGGDAPSGTLVVANGAAGHTDAGFHLFGVVFETDTGYLSAPGAYAEFTTSANLSVSFSAIPVSAQSHVVKRHIVASKVIPSYNGNTLGYIYYFIPGATVNDNVTTTLNNITFFDVDLLEDASHLQENFAEIPAGAVLGMYHNRLILAATFDDISLAYVSTAGEPEAFDQIEGILIVPLDGNPITNAQELRDLLYLFKRNRTVSYADNDDVPATWVPTTADQALGCPVHGVATVIDQGSASVDFLLVATYAGLMIFNGKYVVPELTWKISKLWANFDKLLFKYIQVLNDPTIKRIYLTMPDRRMLYADYENGMDPKGIRWSPWRYDFKVNTIALVDTNTLILGSEGALL
jgi:hypothetical protein